MVGIFEEEAVEKRADVVMTYVWVLDSERGGHCTFCGRPKQVSDYRAGGRVIQLCGSCVENPPGMVKAEVVEEKSETKKKKKFS